MAQSYLGLILADLIIRQHKARAAAGESATLLFCGSLSNAAGARNGRWIRMGIRPGSGGGNGWKLDGYPQ